MAIDIERFKKKAQPIDLLEIIDKAVLQNLINGYSYALSAGGVLWIFC